MKKLHALIILLVVLVIALVLNYYTIPVGVPASNETIKIGFTAPLSGAAAGTGLSSKQGFELANELFPDVNGKKIEVFYGDDKADPALALTAVKKFVEVQNFKLIVSAFSGPTLALIPYSNEKEFLLTSPLSATPKLSGAGKHFFRVSSSSERMAQMTAKVALDAGFTTVAVLYEMNDYPIGWAESFKKDFEEIGGQVILEEQYGSKDTDMRAQLSRLDATDANAIVIISLTAPTASLVLKQAKELGIKKQIIGNETFGLKSVLSLTDLSEGAIVSQYDYNQQDPKTAEFLVAYRKEFTQGESELYSALGYDLYMIMREAISVCGENPVCITAYVKQKPSFVGVSGEYKINSLGDAERNLALSVISNGKTIPYK